MLNKIGSFDGKSSYNKVYSRIMRLLIAKTRGRKDEVLVNKIPGCTWARLEGETLVFRFEIDRTRYGDRVRLDVMRMESSGSWVFDNHGYETTLSAYLFSMLTGIHANANRRQGMCVEDDEGILMLPTGRLTRCHCSSPPFTFDSPYDEKILVAPNVVKWVADVKKRLETFKLAEHLKPEDVLRHEIKPTEHVVRYTQQVKDYLEGNRKVITANAARTIDKANLYTAVCKWCPRAEDV